MEVSEEFLQQQDREYSISFRPVEVAGLLAILLAAERYGGGQFSGACAYLRGVVQGDCDIDVHVDAMDACIDALVEYAQRG
ncbi:hypothetical protein [Cupriavidus necator]|uniref:hypothetical protein n=1 Tax=Cupriavidus necator TaxID=106590 RepID=UPI0009947F20|nr:hypothetical protein [Cupriavidus necator]